jgi:hypothetical protein
MSLSDHPPPKRQELVGPLCPCPHPWSDRISEPVNACPRATILGPG